MKSITLGQYYPASSYLHNADPRAKLIMAFIFILAAFFCKSVIGFAGLVLLMAVLIAISKIPFKMIYRAVRPIIFIMTFTMVINIFFTQGETLLFEWKFISIYLEGIYNAVFMIIRITALVIGSSILITYTTTPIALTDAIESLFAPLKKIKVPVHEFAMMMTIALRFIPTLVDETEKIMAAQKARGADFTNGNLIKRAKALIPILVPLFASSFRRADELATAMECRCYRGGEGRTKLRVLKYKASDVVSILAVLLVCALFISANYWGIGYVM